MANDTVPQGRRYSLIYTDKIAPGKDNPRARNRLYHLAARYIGDLNEIRRRYSADHISIHELSDLLRFELGLKIDGLEQHLQRCNIVDFLDSITCSYQFFLKYKGVSDKSGVFLSEVRRIFAETNLAYQIDDKGGVHPLVDKEFEANRVSAISNLSEARYSGALTAFESAYQAFESNPVKGKEAIRCVFEAAEIVFKLAFPKVNRLGDAELKQKLEPYLQKRYAGDKAATGSSIKVCDGFRDWTNAAHWYRHGQGEEDAVEPPLILTITLLSAGAGYVRWLAELESEMRLLA